MAKLKALLNGKEIIVNTYGHDGYENLTAAEVVELMNYTFKRNSNLRTFNGLLFYRRKVTIENDVRLVDGVIVIDLAKTKHEVVKLNLTNHCCCREVCSLSWE